MTNKNKSRKLLPHLAVADISERNYPFGDDNDRLIILELEIHPSPATVTLYLYV